MPIAFNCEHCGKSIKAPDGSSGKSGTCPGCKKKVLVPAPKPPEDDELRIAPIDEEEEARRKRLEEEDRQIRENIWKEREEPKD
jgi:hypothetical protein